MKRMAYRTDLCVVGGGMAGLCCAIAAACTADIVRNGIERGEQNLWMGSEGESICYTFESNEHVREIRLVFDNDMNRGYHNMPCNYPLV